jgi:hypothetical protein
MHYRLLVLLILFFSFFAAEAESLSLRIHGSNTVGAQLAPALIQAWLNTTYPWFQHRRRPARPRTDPGLAEYQKLSVDQD